MGEPNPSADVAPTGGFPPKCNIVNFRVFTNGLHKGELYPPAEVDQIARNFVPVSRHMTPHLGLGHDKVQRLAVSLGLPNAGDVTGCRSDGRGNLYLDITNVPTWVGAKINAGLYPSGSVELKRDFAPPDDPAHPIPGRYLDGIALLGEEQPAVKGCDRPRATFADGTSVPPNHDPVMVPTEVLSNLTPPAPVAGAHSLCFSDAYAETPAVPDPTADPTPLTTTPEDLVAALKALPPDQLASVLAQVQAQPPTPADPAVAAAKPAGFSDAPPWAKKMSDDFADMTKRFSALEASRTDEQKKTDEHAYAAFSADFDAIFARNDNARRLQPVSREAMKKTALDTFKARAFSADVTPTTFLAALEAQVSLLPIDPRMAQVAQARQGGETVAPNPILNDIVRPGGFLDKMAPKVAAAHRA